MKKLEICLDLLMIMIIIIVKPFKYHIKINGSFLLLVVRIFYQVRKLVIVMEKNIGNLEKKLLIKKKKFHSKIKNVIYYQKMMIFLLNNKKKYITTINK